MSSFDAEEDIFYSIEFTITMCFHFLSQSEAGGERSPSESPSDGVWQSKSPMMDPHTLNALCAQIQDVLLCEFVGHHV